MKHENEFRLSLWQSIIILDAVIKETTDLKKDIIKGKRRYGTRSSETSNISTFEGKIYLNS